MVTDLSQISVSPLSAWVADQRSESAMLKMPFALQPPMVLGHLTPCAKYHELCIITRIIFNRYDLCLLRMMRRLQAGSRCEVKGVLPVHVFNSFIDCAFVSRTSRHIKDTIFSIPTLPTLSEYNRAQISSPIYERSS